MQKPQKKKPAYPIGAVDSALQLIQLLRDGGSIRLKDAAHELGVAPSTAHRLLAMLIYRGFAIQDEAHNYVPGEAIGAGPAGLSWTRQLRSIAQPHMELLSEQINETVNLMIRVGTKVRFLSSVEGTSLLRVGDRRGSVLGAHLASGGKALLAELDEAAVVKLFASANSEIGGDAIPEPELPAFLRELTSIRTSGFAINVEGTEDGIRALGLSLHNGEGLAIGAMSVATPSSRFRRVLDDHLPLIIQARRQLETDLVNVRLD